MQDKADNNPNNRTSENLVELPLPSKNQLLGKKIVKTLLIESENVISSTQFNARPKNDDDTTNRTITTNTTIMTTSKDLNDDSDKVCLIQFIYYNDIVLKFIPFYIFIHINYFLFFFFFSHILQV
jgi:hypothetical protein